MLVLATIQVPAILAMILPIIWAFSNLGIVWAILFTVYEVVACASDMPLKPLLLGRGVSIPSGVILIGAIGGMMSMGMLGLFVVSLGIVFVAVDVVLSMMYLPGMLTLFILISLAFMLTDLLLSRALFAVGIGDHPH